MAERVFLWNKYEKGNLGFGVKSDSKTVLKIYCFMKRNVTPRYVYKFYDYTVRQYFDLYIFNRPLLMLKTTVWTKRRSRCETGKARQRLRAKASIQQLWLDLGIDPCRFAAPQSCWDGSMCLALQLLSVFRGLVVHSHHLFRGMPEWPQRLDAVSSHSSTSQPQPQPVGGFWLNDLCWFFFFFFFFWYCQNHIMRKMLLCF